ncbi:MAG: HipA N-terminal domain-containing protein [Lachnospiraceae bacterium]|nr:HipA N-terminal domain-containing protein [Lachnospiraceae bacterium]
MFFDGLLPEGFTRRSVAQIFHIDPDDYLGILGSSWTDRQKSAIILC